MKIQKKKATTISKDDHYDNISMLLKKPVLTVKDIISLTGLGLSTVMRSINQGFLKAHQINGKGKLFVTKDNFKKWSEGKPINTNFSDFMLWLKCQWGDSDYTQSIHLVVANPSKYQKEYDLFLKCKGDLSVTMEYSQGIAQLV